MNTHVASVVSVLGEVGLKLGILVVDGVLTDMWQEEESQECRENTECRRDEERILASLDRVRVLVPVVQNTEDLGSDEGANLAGGGCDSVVLATNTGSARLGGDQTNIVTRTKLSKSKEDTVDDDKTANILNLGKRSVATSHYKADDSLRGDSKSQCVTWSESVRDERSDDSAWHVEQVDNGVPAKALPEGIASTQQVSSDGTAEDAEAVAGKVVDEPDEGDDDKAETVELDDQPPWCLGFGHAVTLKGFWLLKSDTEVEQGKRWDDPETQAHTPRSSQMVFARCEYDDHRNECGDDETKVDLRVGEQDEPSVTSARLELASTLCAADTSSWILACSMSIDTAE